MEGAVAGPIRIAIPEPYAVCGQGSSIEPWVWEWRTQGPREGADGDLIHEWVLLYVHELCRVFLD